MLLIYGSEGQLGFLKTRLSAAIYSRLRDTLTTAEHIRSEIDLQVLIGNDPELMRPQGSMDHYLDTRPCFCPALCKCDD
jgi:hypothetical protein